MKWRSHTISGDNSVRECFEKINSLSPKFLVVLNNHGGVENTVTDGDLRRLIDSSSVDALRNFWNESVSAHMSTAPRTIDQTALAAEALRVMENHEISVLPVCKSGKLVGVVHLHDLIRAGLA